MKQKLLSILPHASTGGLPQVFLKRAEIIKDDLDIYVVEFNNYSNDFVVQKNRIKKLLPQGHYFTLGDDKNELLKIIKSLEPLDFLHMEEIPELFNISHELASKIYTKDRKYKIFETTHSSDFNVDEKTFFPDKFLFVSQYNCFKFNKFGIPTEVIEYPVEKRERILEVKLEAMRKLKLDPDFKHIVNVGLFTPRKNQAYAFEIARKLEDEKIKFHFIGNQADNFRNYWEPLMKNKPKNCIIWGERDDIDDFLDACDLFLFTSMGFRWNKELNPLVIKEALEHQIPQYLFPLDVYNRKYDVEPTIHYLKGDAFVDSKLVKDFVMERKNLPWEGSYLHPYTMPKYKIRAVHLLLEEDDRKSESIKNLEKLRDYGIDYVQHINKRYTETPPREFCARPWDVGRIGAYSLRGPHYGNYTSFKNAILSEFTDDIDFLMVFESDCILTVPISEFVDKVFESCDYIISNGIYYMSFGDDRNLRTGELVSENIGATEVDWMYKTNKIIGIQSIMFPKFARDFIFRSYETTLWDVSDLLYNEMFRLKTKGIAPRLTTQIEGLSTIQGDNIEHFLLKNINNLIKDKNEKDVVIEFNKEDGRFYICLSDFFQKDIRDIKITVDMGDSKNIYSMVTTLSPNAPIWITLDQQNKYNDFYFNFEYMGIPLFTKKIVLNNVTAEKTLFDLQKIIDQIEPPKNILKEIEYTEVEKKIDWTIDNKNFSVEYKKDENKIYIKYVGEDVVNLTVEICDIESKNVFYRGEMKFSKEFYNWVVPSPSEYGWEVLYYKDNSLLHKNEIRFKIKQEEVFKKEENKDKENIYLVLSYPDTKIKENTTKDCIKSLSNSGKKIILASHYPASKELQELSDFYLYDSHNPLIQHSYYNRYWTEISIGKAEIDLNRLKNKSNLNQSLTVLTNIENAISFAKKAGYKNVISVSYDFIFTQDDVQKMNNMCERIKKENKLGYFMSYKEGDMELLKSVFFIVNVDLFDSIFNVRTPDEYNLECSNSKSHNFLENYFYKKFFNFKDQLIIEKTDEDKFFNNSEKNIFSGVEYLTLLPIKDDEKSFMVWFNSSNDKDDRRIEFVYTNKGLSEKSIHWVKDRSYYTKKITLSDDDDYIIEVYFIDSSTNDIINKQTYNINLDNYSEIKFNGLFTEKK